MRPTNLLFILSDQHRRDASGCYGNPVVRTPNLDRLASRGVRFDNAYTTCPICVPARASLATGRYVHQIRYWDNAFPYEGRVPSWGHRLMADGHRVESIGKLHYRGLEGDEDGFGRKIVPLNVVDAIGDVMGAIRQDLPVRQGARQSILNAKGGASSYLEYDIEIANHACEWLREASQWDDEKPWVLFVSFVCPHPPFVAPMNWFEYYMEQELPLPMQCAPEDRPTHPALRNLRRVLQSEEPYSNEEVRRVTAAYYGACSALDERIGEVLSALDSSGLADSARVIYTSDHGESLGWRGHFGKMTMYEESAGVPLIVAGADAPPGEVLTDLTTWVDIYPTIVEAVGETLTEAERQLPGDSLWGIARGDSKNRIAFSEYHAVGSESASYMARKGRHKLVYYVGQSPQLFDVESDPHELNDLGEDLSYRFVMEELERELRRIVDPDEADRQAKEDQAALVERYGGREAVLRRGTFTNSPTPNETPTFVSGE